MELGIGRGAPAPIESSSRGMPCCVTVDRTCASRVRIGPGVSASMAVTTARRAERTGEDGNAERADAVRHHRDDGGGGEQRDHAAEHAVDDAQRTLGHPAAERAARGRAEQQARDHQAGDDDEHDRPRATGWDPTQPVDDRDGEEREHRADDGAEDCRRC